MTAFGVFSWLVESVFLSEVCGTIEQVAEKAENGDRLPFAAHDEPALRGLQEFLGFGVVFVALFFGAEFFGVGFEAASGEFDGVLNVEHFVE